LLTGVNPVRQIPLSSLDAFVGSFSFGTYIRGITFTKEVTEHITELKESNKRF
jgi:hypothetical protein